MTAQPSTEKETYRLPVILQDLPDLRYNDSDWMSQKGRQIAVGSIKVSVLARLFDVDRLTPDNPEGYQREATIGRVNDLRRDLESSRVDLPTAILLNLRKFDRSTHISESSGLTELMLGTDDSLYVVDGQHRVEALVSLFKVNEDRWGECAIPFVCLLGADQGGEMTEFHVVNSNAKSIGTGLAYELLKRRADSSAAVRDRLTETGRAWVQAAGSLTDKLAKVDIWRDRIQFPGYSKRGTLITSNGMTTSLRALVEQPGYFQSIADSDLQVRILSAYWEGIKLVIPEAMEDPERYNLQRAIGVTAIHSALVNVLAIMGSKGLSVLDPAKFAGVVERPFKELGGSNADGVWVQGADFWKRGNEGASALFNNRAGYRVLHAQIREKLPAVSVN